MARHRTVVKTIAELPRDEWNRCFPGELEAWDYHHAVDAAGLPKFKLLYAAIIEDGHVIAAAPAFLTIYRLDTTLQGPLKQVTEWLARRWTRLLSLQLLCIGSPVTETAQIGFAPEVATSEKPALLSELVAELSAYAAAQRIGLMAVKDARDVDLPLWRAALPGFQRMAGMPTATLPLRFGSLDDYMHSLSAATRKDMRRKRKAERDVRIERRSSVDDVLDRVVALYEKTVARSEFEFEHLPAAYFTRVLASMPERSYCVLYWHGDELLAFNLVLESDDRLIDKFIGTDDRARDYNLYFLSWIENVRHCIARGIPVYQSGQAGYAVKVRLGSRLQLNWYFFRHRNPVLNAVLGVVARLVRLDRFDPEIHAAVHGMK